MRRCPSEWRSAEDLGDWQSVGKYLAEAGATLTSRLRASRHFSQDGCEVPTDEKSLSFTS